MAPGTPAADAPLNTAGGSVWLLDQLGGTFVGLYFAGAQPADPNLRSRLGALTNLPDPVRPVLICASGHAAPWSAAGFDAFDDAEGLAAERYGAAPDTFYLIRPDQHVAARWRHLDIRATRDALQLATGHLTPEFAAWQA
jgi:3-(3-hydroxy-phenyl)propionate hydroxylase